LEDEAVLQMPGISHFFRYPKPADAVIHSCANIDQLLIDCINIVFAKVCLSGCWS